MSWGFLKKAASEIGDAGNAFIDRTGGAIVRGAIRSSGGLVIPRPKAVNDFIDKYAENKGQASKTTGIGHYNEKSFGGKAGRDVGTVINTGVQLYELGKGSKVGEDLTAGYKSRPLSFLGETSGATAVGTAQSVAQGNPAPTFAQALPRGAAQIERTVHNGDDINTNDSPVLKAAFGKEPVVSLQHQYKGLRESGKSPFEAGVSTAVSGVGDVLPLVGLTKLGGENIKPSFADEGIPGKAPGPILEELSKAKGPEEVSAILKKGLPEDVANRIAPSIAKTSDPNIIQNILDKAQPELPNTAPGSQQPHQVIPNTTETPNLTNIADPANATAPTPAALSAGVSNPASLVAPKAAPAVDLAQATIPDSGPSVLGNAAIKGTAAEPPAATSSPVQQILAHLTNAAQTRAKQDAGYAAERSARVGASQAAGQDLTGTARYAAELSKLKGELPKQEYSGISQGLDDVGKETLFAQMQQELDKAPNLSPYDSINTQKVLHKVIFGGEGVPTNSEIALLKKVYGSQLADQVQAGANESLSKKAASLAVQIVGAPKAIMASSDLSGGLRQGAVLGSRFPIEFKNASLEQLKYFAHQDAFDTSMHEIATRPNAALYDRAKLALTGASEHPEEAYASQIAEKIPGAGRLIAASDRAYTGFLTKLRADSFDHIVGDLRDSGINPEDLTDSQLKSIGRFINTASGRGDLGTLEKHAQSLGQALFSPRLWKSRLDMLNPLYYKDLDPIARKYALQAAGSFASIAGTVLGLAALAGAKVETDARSSDFLKIKVGNTRFDILGGFQQNLVLAHRELPGSVAGHKTYVGSGEKKSSLTGGVSKLGDKYGGANRLSVLQDFIQNKENPVISTGSRILKGKDAAGNPINPATEVAKLGIPLVAQDAYQSIQDSGPVGGTLKAVPGFIGIGNQTYSTSLTDKENKTIKKLSGKGASQEKVQAYTEYYKASKVAAGTRTNVSDAINAALQAGDTKKARQLAKDYNTQYASSFQEWRQKYGKYSDATLTKDYKAHKINLTSASLKSRLKTIKNNQ